MIEFGSALSPNVPSKATPWASRYPIAPEDDVNLDEGEVIATLNLDSLVLHLLCQAASLPLLIPLGSLFKSKISEAQ